MADVMINPSTSRLRRVRLRLLSAAGIWILLVASVTWWSVSRSSQQEVDRVVDRTSHYVDSARKMVLQSFAASERIAARMAEDTDTLALAKRYSTKEPAFAALPRPERIAELRRDPAASKVAHSLADIVQDLAHDLIYVTDRKAITLASSDWNNGQASILGETYAEREYFRGAMAEGKNRSFVVGKLTKVPGFYFSARIGSAQEPQGVLILRQSADTLIPLISHRAYDYLVIDRYGMVVATSNPAYHLRPMFNIDKPLPSAETLKTTYRVENPQPITFDRPTSPLHEAHRTIGGNHVLYLAAPIEDTGYQIAIVSRLQEVYDAQKYPLIFGMLIGLLGLGVAYGLHIVMVGRIKEAEAAEELRQLNKQLAEANETKNRYMGIAAHDLRNPLSSLRGLSQLILEMELPVEQQKEFLRTIHQTSDELLGLVNDLLDVSQIEAGKFELQSAPMDLATLVTQRLVHLTPFATRKNIVIEMQTSGACQVMVDKARFSQVIDNLVSNAIKFSPPDSSVRISLIHADGQVRFSVDDQGPGISEEDRTKLFRNFQKLSAVPTAGEKSTGLGLSIVKKIVDAHLGDIRVENLESGGARFTVMLNEHQS